jgi:sigma-B regulation protein RsbU (phosphoserine phosphatase)
MMNKLQNASLMKHLMDHIQDNIYFMDREGRIILINEAGAKWLGFDSPEEVIGKTDLDIFSDEHGRTAFEDEQHIMETGEPILGSEEKETWADGKDTWVSTSKLPLRNDGGDIVGAFGVSRDITAHKEAEILAAKYAEENRQFREILEDDLRMAGELQKTFFPSSYPVFPEGKDAAESVMQFYHHHHAGGMVGGDFCSIRKLSDTEAGIFLCDVMGHGVRAALGTAIVRAMVDEISHKKKDPGQFLKHMNQVLLPILRQEDEFIYATACYMVVDVSTGLVRMANAGHPIPMLLDATNERAEWFVADHSSAGPALAISEDVEYTTVERTIHPGDAVVLFTDGIYEVAGSGQEEFGEQRLLAAAQQYTDLPLQDLFPSLLTEARQFALEGAFDDDVCLVGFRLSELLQR